MRFFSCRWILGFGLTATALAVASGLIGPPAACAGNAGWPLESRADILTAFGMRYVAATGESATHRGVDLAAQSGDRVLSPCAGTVRFVGRVPAAGSEGTQLAVTIEMDDGLRFTLMPLTAPDVSAGARVERGTPIAELAGQGDGSSTSPHLHVGARRGDLYVDPLEFLNQASEVIGTTATGVSGTLAGSNAAASAVTPAASARVSVTQPALRQRSGARNESVRPSAAAEDAGAPAPAGRTTMGPANTADAELVSASPASPFGSAWGLRPAGSASVAVAGARPTSEAFSRLGDLVGALANRGVPAAGRSLSRLVRAWFIAAIALLAATGALWPLWRRAQSIEEPGHCVVPEGAEIAAAAGR